MAKKAPKSLTVSEQHYIETYYLKDSPEDIAVVADLDVELVKEYVAELHKKHARENLQMNRMAKGAGMKEGTYFMTQGMAELSDALAPIVHQKPSDDDNPYIHKI